MVEGEERGPFTHEQLRTFQETGLVTPDTMFKETEEWLPIANVMSTPWQPTHPLGRWFLRISDELRGPFIFDQVRKLWEKGKIPPNLARDTLTLVANPAGSYALANLDSAVLDHVATVSRDLVPDMPDRIIVATAVALGLPLITVDDVFTRSGLVSVIW